MYLIYVNFLCPPKEGSLVFWMMEGQATHFLPSTSVEHKEKKHSNTGLPHVTCGIYSCDKPQQYTKES